MNLLACDLDVTRRIAGIQNALRMRHNPIVIIDVAVRGNDHTVGPLQQTGAQLGIGESREVNLCNIRVVKTDIAPFTLESTHHFERWRLAQIVGIRFVGPPSTRSFAPLMLLRAVLSISPTRVMT